MFPSNASQLKWKERIKLASQMPERLCPYCSQPVKSLSNPLDLCDACFANIPWITDVHCKVCGRAEDCPDCRREFKRYFRMSRSAVRYDPKMKEMLALYKYRGDERLAELMGKMLVHSYHKLLLACTEKGTPDAIMSSIISRKRTGKGKGAPFFDCITYVPVSEERLLDRGFNQAEQMALELAKWVNLPVIPLLCRIRSSQKQSFKTREERLKDMKGIFAPDEPGFTRLSGLTHLQNPVSQPRSLRILLIDDVYTTGSTLNQCSSILSANGDIEVYGLTWAR